MITPEEIAEAFRITQECDVILSITYGEAKQADVTPEIKKVPKNCTCESRTLLHQGCQCGYFNQEKIYV